MTAFICRLLSVLACIAMANGAVAEEPFKVEWILPPIKHTQNNPYLVQAVEEGKRTASDIPAYGPKNPMSERDLDIKQGPNMVRLAELLCHPQSPVKGDQRLVKPLMTLFEAAIDAILNMQGRKNAYSFGSKDVMRTYAILLTVRPDLLTSPLQKRAEQCFHKMGVTGDPALKWIGLGNLGGASCEEFVKCVGVLGISVFFNLNLR